MSMNLSIQCKPGKFHSNADGLSRLPVTTEHTDILDPPEVVFVLNYLDDTPVTSNDIATETRKDPILSEVLNYVLQGWPRTK